MTHLPRSLRNRQNPQPFNDCPAAAFAAPVGDRFDIPAAMPKPRKLDPQELRALGFRESFTANLKNTDDFWKRTKDLRDSVAHFLTKTTGAILHLSDGVTYHDYSLCSAALLQMSYQAFRDLWLYFSFNLNDRLSPRMVLPMKEHRDGFVLRPDDEMREANSHP